MTEKDKEDVFDQIEDRIRNVLTGLGLPETSSDGIDTVMPHVVPKSPRAPQGITPPGPPCFCLWSSSLGIMATVWLGGVGVKLSMPVVGWPLRLDVFARVVVAGKILHLYPSGPDTTVSLDWPSPDHNKVDIAIDSSLETRLAAILTELGSTQLT